MSKLYQKWYAFGKNFDVGRFDKVNANTCSHSIFHVGLIFFSIIQTISLARILRMEIQNTFLSVRWPRLFQVLRERERMSFGKTPPPISNMRPGMRVPRVPYSFSRKNCPLPMRFNENWVVPGFDMRRSISRRGESRIISPAQRCPRRTPCHLFPSVARKGREL